MRSTVYEKEGGAPTYMHTVDAAEAVRLGDYTPAPPGGEQPEPEERASAMSRFKTGQAATHPELQTDEEKEETRRKANEEAAVCSPAYPPGTPIVVQAPSGRPASQAARQAARTVRHRPQRVVARPVQRPHHFHNASADATAQ